ncbi:MAG: sulfotransferase family 2 domain-containing protein [Anaerolineales bacterium]|nr:sulfotransferase family 2 domain-containing protein [Anaerolineales bacterium]
MSETAIFLHIPKTAGTTLSRIIERQHRPGEIYIIAQEEGPYSGPVQHFKSLTADERSAFKLVYGHLPFGIHRHIPGPSTYFTFLREPYQLLRSLYRHAQRDPNHNLHHDLRDLTMRQAIEQGAAQLFDNFQTRAIAGVWHDLPFGACDRPLLEKAKANLRDHFAVVGVVDHFDEVLVLLQKRFGWRSIYYSKHNVAVAAPQQSREDQETEAFVRQHNWLDQELYEYAGELCRQQIAAAGPALAREVRRFQARNRYLGLADKMYWQLRKISVRNWLRS